MSILVQRRSRFSLHLPTRQRLTDDQADYLNEVARNERPARSDNETPECPYRSAFAILTMAVRLREYGIFAKTLRSELDLLDAGVRDAYRLGRMLEAVVRNLAEVGQREHALSALEAAHFCGSGMTEHDLDDFARNGPSMITSAELQLAKALETQADPAPSTSVPTPIEEAAQ